MTYSRTKNLKILLCKATLKTKIEKFNKYMDTIRKINSKAQKWLETNPFLEMGVSHDES